ncbi:hypothetical protein HX13_21720 [Chryseobacterium sp. P1-3]|uniref:Translation elongation factor EFTu/EF1A C-terminal domain-containing protein n=1 Tax=Chryseobacterium gallinarum TaxID=1324352 RepID=A0A0G3M454_CHRGL|nr:MULTISPECIES: hypothetical protein [Chryseobacterium]AKK73619.1 hypothetical protein OK18_14330 [Chryseobacterium gallinarum]KFF73241.1 hypothetical protein HX13_21720 [Chryseobacterium sp. P1-3]
MITIRAKLNLYQDVRQTPFISGYRPTFDLGKGLTSGRILLLNNKKSFLPGEEDEVEINFLSKEFLGTKFKVGEKVMFTEGLTPVGEIEILKILSID